MSASELVRSSENLLKNNVLITSKYAANITELRLMYLALFNIQNGQYEERADGIYVQLEVAELKKALGLNGNGVYSNLGTAAKHITGKKLGYSDLENRYFKYTVLVIDTECKNGILQIQFNKAFKDYLFVRMTGNFTNLEKRIMMSFKSSYAFRLYEILKRSCFYSKQFEGDKDNVFKVTIGISELKFELGVLDSDNKAIMKLLDKKTDPDYEKAESLSEENVYKDWYEFKRRVIDKGIKEIKKIDPQMNIEYQTIKKGLGGKNSAVTFIVRIENSNEYSNNPIKDTPENDENMDRMRDIFGTMLNDKDLSAILKAADNDFEKIQNAKTMLDNTPGKINSVTGWLISAIKNQYSEGNSKNSGIAKKNAFNQFPQREYDFEQLELELLNQTI